MNLLASLRPRVSLCGGARERGPTGPELPPFAPAGPALSIAYRSVGLCVLWTDVPTAVGTGCGRANSFRGFCLLSTCPRRKKTLIPGPSPWEAWGGRLLGGAGAGEKS